MRYRELRTNASAELLMMAGNLAASHSPALLKGGFRTRRETGTVDLLWAQQTFMRFNGGGPRSLPHLLSLLMGSAGTCKDAKSLTGLRPATLYRSEGTGVNQPPEHPIAAWGPGPRTFRHPPFHCHSSPFSPCVQRLRCLVFRFRGFVYQHCCD